MWHAHLARDFTGHFQNRGTSEEERRLTPNIRVAIIFRFADVAELADAQVSEACDGDIVEVQVLSSAP